MEKAWNIAIVGATGTVGSQIIECLEERDFPVGKITCLASPRSAGEVLEFRGKPVMVEELTGDSFAGVDIAFFCAGEERSREFCPVAVMAGAVCIDTSGAWRLDPEVPLVVPEVNPDAIAGFGKKGIIACPDAATVQLVTALKPLHNHARVRRVVVSTYEAVSGSGRNAIGELEQQVRHLLQGKPAEAEVYPHRIAFNCLPHVGAFDAGGSTLGERGLADETRTVMAAEIRVAATCVRVPVFFGQCASVNIETEQRVTAAGARELLAVAPGVELVDDPADNLYPMPIDAAGQDLILVGRIREDASVENGLNLWLAADNVRKGAATNAVQIAERLVEDYME